MSEPVIEFIEQLTESCGLTGDDTIDDLIAQLEDDEATQE